MTNKIHVKNASVKEVSVTVQNVVIGKRQLTQRVFKQIQVAPIFDRDSEDLKGEAWGYVNYFWPDNEYRRHQYKHILWVNKNGELRRCFVEREFSWWKGNKCEHAVIYLLTKLPQLYIAV